MGPTWGRQVPGGPHVGPMNFAIWDLFRYGISIIKIRWSHESLSYEMSMVRNKKKKCLVMMTLCSSVYCLWVVGNAQVFCVTEYSTCNQDFVFVCQNSWGFCICVSKILSFNQYFLSFQIPENERYIENCWSEDKLCIFYLWIIYEN